jgi:hypothetical protein
MRLAARQAALAALAIFIAVAAVLAARPVRGWNLWFAWQVDATERFERWLNGGGADAGRAAFEQAPRLFPLTGWLAAAASPSSGHAEALHAIGILSGAAIAAMLFLAANRCRGVVAGLVATALFAGAPRLWIAAELYPSTLLGTALATAVILLLTLCKGRAAWVGASALLAVGLLCGLPGWWLLPLGLYLLLVDPHAAAPGGLLQLREGAWPRLIVVGLFLLVALLIPPPLRTPKGWGALFRVWLEAGAEPMLVAGELFGRERLSVGAVFALLLRTLPPLFWPGLLATAGFLMAGRDASGRVALCPVLRRWFGALAFLIAMPVVFRSGYHGGQDLLFYLLPLLALLAGLGITTAVDLAARRIVALEPWTAAILVGLLGLASLDVTRAWSLPEAYGVGWQGGTAGLVRDGYSRYAHGPLPIEWLADQVGDGPARIGLAANEWEYRPLVEAYIRRGWLPKGSRIAPVGEADGVLVPFEDALPERLPHLRDAQRAISAGQARTIKADEVPLLVWVPTPRAAPAPVAKAAAGRAGFARTGPTLRSPKTNPSSPTVKAPQRSAPSSKAP